MRNPPMNKKVVLRCAIALICTVAADVAPLPAQGLPESLSVGLAGGFSKGQRAIGYHALATLELPLSSTVLRLRADGLFADWGVDRVSALTANLLFAPISRGGVASYALAGAGGYAQGGTGAVRSGWTLGLGVRLPGKTRSFFLESRLHTFRIARHELNPPYSINTRWRAVFTPIGIGIQF